jgi:hypothetical protein
MKFFFYHFLLEQSDFRSKIESGTLQIRSTYANHYIPFSVTEWIILADQERRWTPRGHRRFSIFLCSKLCTFERSSEQRSSISLFREMSMSGPNSPELLDVSDVLLAYTFTLHIYTDIQGLNCVIYCHYWNLFFKVYLSERKFHFFAFQSTYLLSFTF